MCLVDRLNKESLHYDAGLIHIKLYSFVLVCVCERKREREGEIERKRERGEGGLYDITLL